MYNERILSSLPLQVLLYFNSLFTKLWFFLSLCIFIYKSYKLPYLTSAIRWELSVVFLLPILDLFRINLVTRGNKTENGIVLLGSAFLSVPTALGYVFFFEWQTYVLHIDKWLNAMALAFLSGEMLLLLFTAVLFARSKWVESYSHGWISGFYQSSP